MKELSKVDFYKIHDLLNEIIWNYNLDYIHLKCDRGIEVKGVTKKANTGIFLTYKFRINEEN